MYNSLSGKNILNEINYFLKIYESAISYFLIDLEHLKKIQNSIKIFNNIRDKYFNLRKRELFKFRIGLEDKLNLAKKEIIYEKQSKNIIRRHTVYFPQIPVIKLRKNKSQEKLIFRKFNRNNSNSNINIDYSSLYY